jgi:hypothetical protein
MIAGTTTSRATGVSPGTYGRTSPSGVRMRARNSTARSTCPRARPISPLSRSTKGQVRSGPELPA